MTRRERVALAICIALHAYVLWNVYRADRLTPRIIKQERCIDPWEHYDCAERGWC